MKRALGLRRLGAATGMGVIAVLALAGTAHAHPLGNLAVNHYDGLRLHPDRIENTAVVSTAEIPTLQEKSAADLDHDGTISVPERATRATALCHDLAGAIDSRLNGHRLSWTVNGSSLNYVPGAAGLETSRLTCRLSAAADLSRNATFTFRNGYRDDRTGWHEITATGDGVRLPKSVLPTRSVSDELRRYPGDQRTPPLDLRSATILTAPTTGVPGPAGELTMAAPGMMHRWADRLTVALDDLVGGDRPTLAVGLLAGCLAFLLGAAHAALPGHGKTATAAYLAGRRGAVRDAVLVGATVTATHTTGVLVLGLVLLLSASLAGETALAYLALAGGLLVTAVGVVMLRSAWQVRHPRRRPIRFTVRMVPGRVRRTQPPSTRDPRPIGPGSPASGTRQKAKQRVETPPWWWTPWQPEWRTEWQSPWVSDSLLTPTAGNARAATPDQVDDRDEHPSSDTDVRAGRSAQDGHPGTGGRHAGERSEARSDEDWWPPAWVGEPAEDGFDDRDERSDDTVAMELPIDDLDDLDDVGGPSNLDDWPAAGLPGVPAVVDGADGSAAPTGLAAPPPTLNGHTHRDVHGHDLPRRPAVHQELPPTPEQPPPAGATSAVDQPDGPVSGQDTPRERPPEGYQQDDDLPAAALTADPALLADSSPAARPAQSAQLTHSPEPAERSRRSPHPRRRGRARRPGRAGLVALGVAGGLVPSPSAMVVLLGAVALGHTVLGVALVVAYGLGVAVMLVVAGLLLARVRGPLGRLRRRSPDGRAARVLGSVHGALPFITGGLVLAAGLLLTMRALLPMG